MREIWEEWVVRVICMGGVGGEGSEDMYYIN